LSDLGTDREVVAAATLAVDHVDEGFAESAVGARSFHPAADLSVIVVTPFAAVKVTVPMHPPVRVLLVDPMLGFPKLECGTHLHTIRVDRFVVILPRACEVILWDALPPRSGILFVDVVIVVVRHSRVNGTPIRPAKTTHGEDFARGKVGSEFRVIVKYNFSGRVLFRHSITEGFGEGWRLRCYIVLRKELKKNVLEDREY
jgi:hypothetical protein